MKNDDDFLLRQRRAPRPEFASKLYKRISKPMNTTMPYPTAGFFPRPAAMWASLTALALIALLVFSPTAQHLASQLLAELGRLLLPQMEVPPEPDYIEQNFPLLPEEDEGFATPTPTATNTPAAQSNIRPVGTRQFPSFLPQEPLPTASPTPVQRATLSPTLLPTLVTTRILPRITPEKVNPTPTAGATATPGATLTPTPLSTVTPITNTPYIGLSASCYNGPTVQFTVHGGYWSNQESINLYLDNALITVIAAGHGGSFSRALTAANVTNGVHVVRATSTSASYQVSFTVPCEAPSTATPSPTVLASVTTTPTPTAVPPTLTATRTPSPTPTITPTPLPTLTITRTPSPTPTITRTPLPTPTQIPGEATLWLDASCYNGSNIQYIVSGSGWNDKENIQLFLDNGLVSIVPNGHGGSFTRTLTANGLAAGTHTIKANTNSGSTEKTVMFVTPCPTAGGDLVVLGLELLSPSPVTNYQPLQFRVTIQNQSSTPITSQFFMDLFFDVPAEAVTPTGISPEYAAPGAYTASEQIGAHETQVFTMNAPYGFQNNLTNHTVYVMVDSVSQIGETTETNNLSGPLSVSTLPDPTPTPLPSGLSMSGMVFRLTEIWAPQPGTTMYLVYVQPGQPDTVIQTQQSAADGSYNFTNVPAATGNNSYKVIACFTENNLPFVGTRSPLTPPNQFVNVYLFGDSGSCPYN